LPSKEFSGFVLCIFCFDTHYHYAIVLSPQQEKKRLKNVIFTVVKRKKFKENEKKNVSKQ
jgi:hypothetical protein